MCENRRAKRLKAEDDRWNNQESDFEHAKKCIENKKNGQVNAGTYSNGYFISEIKIL